MISLLARESFGLMVIGTPGTPRFFAGLREALVLARIFGFVILFLVPVVALRRPRLALARRNRARSLRKQSCRGSA